MGVGLPAHRLDVAPSRQIALDRLFRDIPDDERARVAHATRPALPAGVLAVALRIGAAQGFSGDDPRGLEEIIVDGVDYICCEALAEITLTTMYRERQRDEHAGYAHDASTSPTPLSRWSRPARPG